MGAGRSCICIPPPPAPRRIQTSLTIRRGLTWSMERATADTRLSLQTQLYNILLLMGAQLHRQVDHWAPFTRSCCRRLERTTREAAIVNCRSTMGTQKELSEGLSWWSSSRQTRALSGLSISSRPERVHPSVTQGAHGGAPRSQALCWRVGQYRNSLEECGTKGKLNSYSRIA